MSQEAQYSVTVDKENLEHLSKLSNVWWDLNGPFLGLHRMNALRIPLVVDGILSTTKTASKPNPLEGFKIMDVGCGGGILAEPLTKTGAEVIGLDPSEELISVARQHAATDLRINRQIDYVQGTIEEYAPANPNSLDAIIASEVIEHVNEPKLFLEYCVKALKPGGSIFVTTINKTYLSYFAAIIYAEYISQLIPKGTHDWNKFVSPDDVSRWLDSFGCTTVLTHGMLFNPLTKNWSWSSRTPISYALHAVKRKSEESS